MPENSIGEQFRSQVLKGISTVDSDISSELHLETRKFLLEDRITSLARIKEGLDTQTSGFNAIRRGLFYGAAAGLALTLGSPEAGMVVGGTLLSLDLLRRGTETVTAKMLGLLQEARVGQLDKLNQQESSASVEAISAMQTAIAELEAAYRPTLTMLDEHERKRVKLEHLKMKAAMRRNEMERQFDVGSAEYLALYEWDRYEKEKKLETLKSPGFFSGWKDALRQQGMNEEEILLHLRKRYGSLLTAGAPVKTFMQNNIENPLEAMSSVSP